MQESIGLMLMKTELEDPSHQRSTISAACSSYFIEPVEWMEELLPGDMEGKVIKIAKHLGIDRLLRTTYLLNCERLSSGLHN